MSGWRSSGSSSNSAPSRPPRCSPQTVRPARVTRHRIPAVVPSGKHQGYLANSSVFQSRIVPTCSALSVISPATGGPGQNASPAVDRHRKNLCRLAWQRGLSDGGRQGPASGWRRATWHRRMCLARPGARHVQGRWLFLDRRRRFSTHRALRIGHRCDQLLPVAPNATSRGMHLYLYSRRALGRTVAPTTISSELRNLLRLRQRRTGKRCRSPNDPSILQHQTLASTSPRLE